MPSRYRRARLDADDPRINIRNRYNEAIRAGATIKEATDYANGVTATFTRTAPVEETAPQVIKHRVAPTPGDGEQLLPGKVVGEIPPPPPATDLEIESVKRPMAAPAATPAPVSSQAAVSTSVETKATAETPAKTKMRAPLPEGWDRPEFEWPRLRGICMAMGLQKPVNRTEAVKAIKAVLEPPPDATAAATKEQAAV